MLYFGKIKYSYLVFLITQNICNFDMVKFDYFYEISNKIKTKNHNCFHKFQTFRSTINKTNKIKTLVVNNKQKF